MKLLLLHTLILLATPAFGRFDIIDSLLDSLESRLADGDCKVEKKTNERLETLSDVYGTMGWDNLERLESGCSGFTFNGQSWACGMTVKQLSLHQEPKHKMGVHLVMFIMEDIRTDQTTLLAKQICPKTCKSKSCVDPRIKPIPTLKPTITPAPTRLKTECEISCEQKCDTPKPKCSVRTCKRGCIPITDEPSKVISAKRLQGSIDNTIYVNTAGVNSCSGNAGFTLKSGTGFRANWQVHEVRKGALSLWQCQDYANSKGLKWGESFSRKDWPQGCTVAQCTKKDKQRCVYYNDNTGGANDAVEQICKLNEDKYDMRHIRGFETLFVSNEIIQDDGMSVELGTVGSNGCRTYLTPAQCKGYAIWEGLTWDRSATWPDYPKGCFWQTEVGRVYFNEHKRGAGISDPATKPVCKTLHQ